MNFIINRNFEGELHDEAATVLQMWFRGGFSVADPKCKKAIRRLQQLHRKFMLWQQHEPHIGETMRTLLHRGEELESGLERAQEMAAELRLQAKRLGRNAAVGRGESLPTCTFKLCFLLVALFPVHLCLPRCCRYRRGTRRQQSGPGTICAVERWLGHSLPAELTRSRRRQTERSSPSTTRDSIRVKLPHAPPCTTTRTVLLYCAEHTRPCHTRPSRHCRHPICTQARFAHAELRPTSPGRTRVPARHTGCTSGGETDHVARPCESQAHLDVASPLGRVASRQVHADDGQGGTRAVV